MQVTPPPALFDSPNPPHPDIKITLPITTPDNFSDGKTNTPPTPLTKEVLSIFEDEKKSSTATTAANGGECLVSVRFSGVRA